MSPRILAAVLAGSFIIPATAYAQSRVAIPNVELFATVTGKWVLDPRACRDIREDVRDARVATSRRDLREDRRDQRVADCPASAYVFVPDAGQGPKYPVRVGRGRVERKLRGQPMFINGDTIGPDGLPLETPGQVYAPVSPTPQYVNPQYRAPQPTYQQPTYARPAYRAPAPAPTYTQPVQPQYGPRPTYQQPVQPAQPTYRQPSYQTAPNTYQQPTYQQQPVRQPTYRQPTYQPAAPAPAPAEPSKYRIENGVIIFE